MKILLKISLAISILGILVLLILSNTLNPKLTKIENINKKLINQKIQVKGEIINIKNFKNLQIITIKDSTGRIDLVLYENLNLSKKQTIIAFGRVNTYKDQIQISADKIIKTDNEFEK